MKFSLPNILQICDRKGNSCPQNSCPQMVQYVNWFLNKLRYKDEKF